MRKFLRNIFITLLLCVLYFVAQLLIFFAITKNVDMAILQDDMFWWIYALVIALGAGLTVFRLFNVWETKRILKVNDGLEESRWLTADDVEKSENLTLTTLKKVSKFDGIPIYARAKGKNDLDIILAKQAHVLAIGTTGSGKTSGFIEPEIEILSQTKEQPSMIVGDPKGEIYAHRSKALQERGYRVVKIDLTEPYKSIRWNPFASVIRYTNEINGCDLPDGDARKVYIQERKDRIFEELKDIIESICPIESKSEPTWEKAARDFILAIALIIQQRYQEGAIKENNFNLANLHHNVLEYGTPKGIEELAEYFERIKVSEQIISLAQPIMVAEGKTLTSYLSEVQKFMTWLVDNGICALTSSAELDTATLDEQPTALFLIIPEEKATRYKLVTLFVTQLYKDLLAKARRNVATTGKQELIRTTYFLLDEFGNLPKIPLIDKIITAGRGRKIFLQAVIQDYAQLDAKYGKEKAAMIRSNCNIKVFIGSTDSTTLKEYSELCGKTKTKNVAYNGRQDTVHVNLSATERPLIHASELARLNDPPNIMGNAIVLAFGKYPLKAKFAPIFKTAAYAAPGVCDNADETRYFNAEDCYVDVLYAKAERTTDETLTRHVEERNNNVEENATSEPLEVENVAPVEIQEERKPEVVKMEIKRKAYMEIDDRLVRFKDKLSEQDFIELRRADFNSKLTLLNQLSNRAREQENKILAADLLKTAALLQAQYSDLLVEKTHEEKKERADDKP